MTSPIYNTSRTVSYTLSNNTVNNELDIGLVGDGYLGYGPVINTNLVKLLENFSNTTAPTKAIKGQLWYDSANKLLKIYDGGFFANVYSLPNSISVGNITVDQDLVSANASVARLYTTTGIFWHANGNVYTGDAVAAGNDTQIQFNSGGVLEGSYGLTTDGLNLNITGTTTTQIANVDTIFVSSSIKWSNNVPYSTGITVTPKGPAGALQFNNSGEFGGATGLSTNGQNLYITGELRASGIRYPMLDGVNGQVITTDGSGNLSWKTINVGTLTGSGQNTQLASFNSSSNLQGTAEITTNGQDLTMANGTLNARNITLSFGTTGAITFPDGTTQNTAARFETGGVFGSGTTGQFAYFKTTNSIKSTAGITTNGSDMTIGGTLSVAISPTAGIHVTNKDYVDNLISLTRAYIDTKTLGVATIAYVDGKLVPYATKFYVDEAISNIHLTGGTVGGTGVVNHLAVWQSTSLIKNADNITTNGTDITLSSGKITLITPPTATTHATNKEYVDLSIANAIARLPPPTTVVNSGVQAALGTANRLAYYNTASSIKSSSITIEGSNLTISDLSANDLNVHNIEANEITASGVTQLKNTNVEGTVYTYNLNVTGNWGLSVGSTYAAIKIGEDSTSISHSYASSLGQPESMDFAVGGSNYVSLKNTGISVNGNSKNIKLFYPLVFPDGTIQTTATVSAGTYSLPMATDSVLGGVKVDNSTIIINANGVISAVTAGTYSLPTATNLTLGGVKVDASTINISGTGVISARQYTLPTASTTVLGGVKVDNSTININGDGIISAVQSLPTASSTNLGVIKVGAGLTISNGVLSTSINNLQISYPTTIYAGETFTWGITGAKGGETWYATTTASTVLRYPSSPNSVVTLPQSGAATYSDGYYGSATGDVTVVFYFSQSGIFVKRLTILNSQTYGGLGSYTMTSGSYTPGSTYTTSTNSSLPSGTWRCMGTSGSLQTFDDGAATTIYVPIGGDNTASYTIGGNTWNVDTRQSMFVRIS